MRIAVLSGKGGAGKTLVSVNLAAAAGRAVYVDCDVEEPNGHLFLKPSDVTETTVFTVLPSFQTKKCTGCRKCIDFCRFHALIYIKEKPMVFPEVCHSCGGCALVCPEGAVTEKEKPVGVIRRGQHGEITVITGIMNPGEASGIPIIHASLQGLGSCALPVIVDCPPGSACSVMESVEGADYCVLVAEPTAFGFHNFCMVHELASLMGKPCGVIINKQASLYPPLESYCLEHRLPVLARIPYDAEIARLSAGGEVVAEVSHTAMVLFQDILSKIGDVSA